MASLSFSFAALSRKNCDISKRYPGVKELPPLTFCEKDIRSHLRMIKVGQTSLPTQRDLILCLYWSLICVRMEPTWQSVQHTMPNLDYFGGL